MSLRTPSRRARTLLWSAAAAAGFGLDPLDLLRAQDAPRPGMLLGLGREVRGILPGREADDEGPIRSASAGNRADGAVKPGSMRPLGAPRPLFEGTAPVGRPIETAGPVPAPAVARPAVPTAMGAAFPGPRPIQQTTGQLAPAGASGATPAYHAPAPQQAFPPQPVAQQAAPESEVMRQLRLRYAQEGREMPAMDPAAVTPPSPVMPAAPQMAPVRNPAPDFHRTENVAGRPGLLSRILPFGKKKPTPAAVPMPPQAPPVQYPTPHVAAQPTMPQRPVAPQPTIAPQQVFIPPAATPMQAATPTPIVRPATSPSAPPAQFAPQAPTRMATAPAQIAAPQPTAMPAAPVATAPAAPVARPTPTAAPAAQIARPLPQTPTAPVATAPASAPATPEFRIILDAPAQAQAAPQPSAAPEASTAPVPIAAPATSPKPEATAATEPAPATTGEEFPDPFTEVSEEQADAAKKSPFTGRRLDPTAAPAIQPARTASTEPARMTEPAATPAPLPTAAPAPTAAPQSVAQPEPAVRPAPQPTVESLPAPPSADERQAKLQKIAARQDRKGLKGFCPVALRDGRDLVDTLPEFSSVFESRLYYFASSEAKTKFDQNPTRYAPVAGGSDVILMHETGSEVEGRLDHALWYQDRLFLFSSRDTLGRFVKHLAEERASASANGSADDADEDDKD